MAIDGLVDHGRRVHSRQVIPGALNGRAHDDAPALALRGIAMAQLGDFVRAKILCGVLRVPSVQRSGGPRGCIVEAEITRLGA